MPIMLASSTIATAAIAAGAAVLSTILTLVGVVVTSRSKLKELQVAHEQARSDAHLRAAQAHSDDLYVPLSAALGALADAFLNFRATDGTQGDGLDTNEQHEFDTAVGTFVDESRALIAGGRDAYLTVAMDTLPHEFMSFLGASRNADHPRAEVVLTLLGWTQTTEVPMPGRSIRTSLELITRLPRFLSPLRLFGTAMSVKRVVAAPFTSAEFAQPFQEDVFSLRGAIRDVTLGATTAT